MSYYKKFNNKKINGFDSKLESRTYDIIQNFISVNDLKDIELIKQHSYEVLPPSNYRGVDIAPIKYIIDFALFRENGDYVFIESKGLALEVYNIKKKLLLTDDVNFIEIKSDNIKILSDLLHNWYYDNSLDVVHVFEHLRPETSRTYKAQLELKEVDEDLIKIYKKITTRPTTLVKLDKFIKSLGVKVRERDIDDIVSRLDKHRVKKRNKIALSDKQVETFKKLYPDIIAIIKNNGE